MLVGNYGTFSVKSLLKKYRISFKNISKYQNMKPVGQERFGNRTDTFRLGVKDRSLVSVFF